MNPVQMADKIRAAFSNTTYPGDDWIGTREVKDFIGKRWEEVSVQQTQSAETYLEAFNFRGMSYFLPAFLLAIVEHYNQMVDELLPETLLSLWLAPRRVPESQPYFVLMVNQLTPDQKETIYEYVLSLRDLDPVRFGSSTGYLRERLEKATEYWKKEAQVGT